MKITNRARISAVRLGVAAAALLALAGCSHKVEAPVIEPGPTGSNPNLAAKNAPVAAPVRSNAGTYSPPPGGNH